MRVSFIVHCVVVAVLAGYISANAHAMTANPGILVVSQPDGQTVELRFKGGPMMAWHEDLQGYPVHYVNGRYLYQVSLDPGVVSSLEVGKVDPEAAGVSRFTQEQRAAAQSQSGRPVASAISEFNQASGARQIAATGTVRNLVLLLRFSNHRTRTLPSKADYEVLFNAIGGDPSLAPTGSIKDLYLENSYGQLSIQSTVVGWIDLPQSESYYANGSSGLSIRIHEAIRAGLEAADAVVDFSDFDQNNDGYIDAISLVHSGYPAEVGGTDEAGAAYVDRIWSHSWDMNPEWQSAEGVKVFDYNINPGLWGLSGGEICHIGVIAHELGHFFGLPDLYDTDAGGEGLGSWGLMSNSWGFGGQQYDPPHFSAWSKAQLGWTVPQVISAAGSYTIDQSETTPQAYKITQGFPAGEYLLIENRQPVGTESNMPQGGLVVFHVDELKFDNQENSSPGLTTWPQQHYKVAVVQADNAYDLERGNSRGDAGDPYHAGGNAVLTPETSPASDSYQSGVFQPTGVFITNVSASSSTMTFDLQTNPDPCGSGTAAPVFTLARNTWELVSLPCEPPAGSTIGDILGDDIPGVYGRTEDWVIFQYSPLAGSYTVPSINDPMTVGTGYWLIQDIQASVTIDLPGGSSAASTTVHGGAACESTLGCLDIELSGAQDTVNTDKPPRQAFWSLLGHPFESPTSFDDLRVSTAAGVCSDYDGCLLNEARTDRQVYDTLWSYDSSSGAYDPISNGATLEPWKGYWIAEMDGTGGVAPTLHIPR